MDIESQLPDDFDQRTDEEKAELLRELKQEFDDSTDAGAVKVRMIEEMIRQYSSP